MKTLERLASLLAAMGAVALVALYVTIWLTASHITDYDATQNVCVILGYVFTFCTFFALAVWGTKELCGK